jgi:epoxyqueuosine reductase QueG
MISAILDDSFRAAGLETHGVVCGAALREVCSGMPASLRERLGTDEAGCAVVAALAYGEGPDAAPSGASFPPFEAFPGPLARLARFARADWYAELGARLKKAAALIREGLRSVGEDPGPAGEWRYFVNSRLPEKRLAIEAGIGTPGRNGLVMVPKRGSAVVLGALLPPAGVSLSPIREAEPIAASTWTPDAECEGCGACVAACPTGALDAGGAFARERCLQHWSSIPGTLPPDIEAAWGERLYGCDACQEACPRFKPDASASTSRGLLGPGLPAAWLVSASDAEIGAALKGTVLGMRWIAIGALRRNAALALRGVGGVAANNEVTGYRETRAFD